MQKYPFASAGVIAQHFLTTVPTIKDIFQRELGMGKFSRCWVPHFLCPAQKVARFEASKTILLVLQDAASNDFEGIATGDESWFSDCCPSSTIFARAPSEIIPRTRQIWRERNNDNDFLHCTLTNPVECTTKRKQI
jgi:hypothetical protein